MAQSEPVTFQEHLKALVAIKIANEEMLYRIVDTYETIYNHHGIFEKVRQSMIRDVSKQDEDILTICYEFVLVGRTIMAQAYYVRNPYPVPDVSREGTWISRGPVLGDKILSSDRDWNVKLNVHERLFAHHTLNSIRRDRRFIRPQVPDDALDLALNSIYTHSRDCLVSKIYVPIQPETLGRETWRVLRNEIKIYPEPPKPDRPKHVSGHSDEELKSIVRTPLSADKSRCHSGPTLPRRIHPSSVKLNIEGPHMDQSNPGYSRKIDGTFYNI